MLTNGYAGIVLVDSVSFPVILVDPGYFLSVDWSMVAEFVACDNSQDVMVKKICHQLSGD